MKYVKDILWGLALVVFNQIAMLLVSSFFDPNSGNTDPTVAQAIASLTINAAGTALLMGIAAFFLTGFLKTTRMAEAYRRGILWTLVLIGFYLLIGFGNQTLEIILKTPTAYLMYLLTFLGPVLYGKLKKLN